jgi:hypothetical protein
MGLRFTRLAAARKILDGQNLVLQQVWHLHMKSALMLVPTWTPWVCHAGKIEKTMGLLGGRGTGILKGLKFYRQVSLCFERITAKNYAIHGNIVYLRPRVPAECDSSVAISRGGWRSTRDPILTLGRSTGSHDCPGNWGWVPVVGFATRCKHFIYSLQKNGQSSCLTTLRSYKTLSLGFSGRDYWKRSIGITITTATFSTPDTT